MNTKLVMTLSALVFGLVGLALTFLPDEISNYINTAGDKQLSVITLQLLGSLYFAFAMLNWTAKANLIGGIYGRPIAIGNVTHLTIGALAISKAYFSSYLSILLIPVIVYAVFAILFGIIFFTHPVQRESK